jgi:hypothetical protein
MVRVSYIHRRELSETEEAKKRKEKNRWKPTKRKKRMN